jgi:cellulose synthase/poly-beta-1,6-N-acetylglucosamine synthase-like glycosyltransferase
VVDVGLPHAALARFQVVEYLRAFLAGRTALSALDALLIISGAFGLFRRDAVVDVGGFRTDTVGEDMEIVVRLHRMFRERRQPCRIVFRPDAVCWTEAPEGRSILRSQRNRWQRGTSQVMEYHRALLCNPRHGMVGLFGMPFYFLFEAIGPIVEVVGLAVTLLAVAFGLLDWRFAWLIFLAAVVYGAVNSVGAILLEEVSYRRYARLVDLLTLCAYACVENLGYRQLTAWWRVQGTLDYFRKKHTWGTMTRKGFAPTAG